MYMNRFRGRSLLLAVAILFTFVEASNGQSPGVSLLTGNVQNSIRVSYNGEAITVANTSIGFTSATINPTCTGCPINTLRATTATCTLQTGNIIVRSDGTAPTSTVGLLITAGQSFAIYGYTDISNFRAIRVTSTSGDLYCQYSR